MDIPQKITDFIQKSVAELSDRPIADIGADTAILGEGAVLDSRDLVVLMLDVEEFLETEFNASFDWASNSALSGTRSRMRTVGSLTDFVAERARDNAG
jgi:acyl carrier protein